MPATKGAHLLKRLGNWVLPYLLWIISCGLGLVDFAAAFSFLRLAAALVTPDMPGETVRMTYTIHTITLFGVVILGLAWLIGGLVLLHYYEQDNKRGRLWGRFLRITLIEGVIVIAWLLLPQLLRLLL